MIKKLLFLGCFLNMITSLNAQTTLSAGDMAIIGINYDAVPYEITIMNLVPIASGTVIRITDYGYDEITGTFGTTSVANTSEGSITWTTTSAIATGTAIKFTINAASGTPVVSGLPGTVSATGWTNATISSCPSPAGGDNWFIFQGSSATSVTTYVFAWCNPFATTFNSINQPAGQFLVPGTGLQPNNGNSYLPPSLTLGTNAISLSRDPASGGYHGDNNVYVGSLTGTKNTLMTAICTISNWNHDETTTYNITPGGAIFTGSNPVFTISTPNNAPTDIALSAAAINENVAGNSTVGTLSSTDIDAGNTFTYTLVVGTGSTDNASFNISGSGLRITASPDFETKSSYSVRVRTTDQGSLFFEKAFIITINDLNETPTDLTLSVAAINENVAGNSTVGTLSSTDVDAGNTFTYTLVAGTGSTDNASFNISGSGLRITASPDFETKSSYSVRVRTTDQGSLFFEKAFTITINDLNETPTDLTLSAAAINENVAGNSTVGTLSSTDVDAGNTFTYTLVAGTGSTDNASFNISGSGLRITASPDFETKSSYSVRVRTTDQGSLFFEKAFTITINDLNETPADLTLSAAAINENVAANSTAGTLSSTDVDAGNTFTYTLVAGTGSTDNASFNISGSGLRITASPDFETKSSYSVRVRTTDQGSLFFEKAFTITINDLCDLNNTVTQSSGVLTATQTGASYQWYNCSNNLPVGTNSNTYTPTVVGDYKVDITSGSCTVTSTCVTVTTLGITNFETNSGLLVYPNPSQGIVNIKSDSDGNFQVVNQLGQIVKTFKVEANVNYTIDLQNFNDGIYFIKEATKNKPYKLIIKK